MKKYSLVIAIAIIMFAIPTAEAQDVKLHRQRIESDFGTICSAADGFKLDTGRYPTQSEGLVILLPNGGGFPTPRTTNPKGYLKSIPIDPWGRPYVYIAWDTDFRVLTYGANGIPGGTGDDEDVSGCEWENRGLKTNSSRGLSVFAGEAITDANWSNHPEIIKIRSLYNEINASEKANKLKKETKKCALNNGNVEIDGELYKDQRGIIRKYVVDGGTGDSRARAEYYYNEKGIARFTYRFRGAYNGTKIEDRIYFDEKGQHLYTNHKSEGLGYTESGLTDSVADPRIDYANLCKE